VTTCALPYPSDEFTVADPASATGLRLAVPDDLLRPSVVAALGPGGRPVDAFGGRDGFSAIGPVVFETSAPVDPASIPADGGEVVAVFDAATGERAPIRVEVPWEAAARGAPGTVVMAWPDLRWEYGHTYVARLAGARGLLTRPVPPAAVATAGSGGGLLGVIRGDLERIEGLDWARVQQVTRFTVGSRQDAVGGLERMAAIARSTDHPVRNLRVIPPVLDGVASVVRGEVAITDFRDGDGALRPDLPPSTRWIPFLLAVPSRPASPAGAPVAVYGHGLVINKESMLLVARQNALKGVATIGIDAPNHGERIVGEGGYLTDLARPWSIGRLIALPGQGIVDNVSLVAAVQQHLGSLDMSPWRPTGAPGDGVVDLDTRTLLYEGTSMGGVLGVAEVALAPDIDAAFLQVPGVGIADILFHSILWPVFAKAVPPTASGGEAGALVGALTMLLDVSDATHLLEGLADSGRPVVAQIGVGDHIVANSTSDRLVQLLRLPRFGPARTDIRAPWAGDLLPADGRGFVETWPSASSPATQGFVAHLSFTEPSVQALLDTWLDQRLAAEGVLPAGSVGGG
jgi:hypothetical protein